MNEGQHLIDLHQQSLAEYKRVLGQSKKDKAMIRNLEDEVSWLKSLVKEQARLLDEAKIRFDSYNHTDSMGDS